MSQLTVSLRDVMLEATADTIIEVSLHSADPGTTGASEIEGGDYARQPVDWNPATNAAVTVSDNVVFDVPGGGTQALYLGMWAEDDTFCGHGLLSNPDSFQSPGTYTLTEITVALVNPT